MICRFLPLLLSLTLSTSLLAEGFTGKQIQQFIDDAIAAGGGEVVLPQGRHRLSEPLRIKDASKLRLIGLDAEDTHLLPATDITQPFPLLLIEGKISELSIAKLTFTTDGSSQDFANHPLIAIRSSTSAPAQVEIERCLFEKHSGPGILVEHVKASRITANSFMDLTGPGIQVQGTSETLLIQHNHLTRTAPPAIQLSPEAKPTQLQANEIIPSP